MQRRLAVNIAARDPETGVVRTFLAGSTVPAWAAERITNPDVWAPDGPDAGEVAAIEEAAEKVEFYSDLLDDDPGDADGDDGGDPEPTDDGPQQLERPPEGGKGSGRDAWAAYAAQEGVDVDDEMTREDIIDAVDDAARIEG